MSPRRRRQEEDPVGASDEEDYDDEDDDELYDEDEDEDEDFADEENAIEAGPVPPRVSRASAAPQATTSQTDSDDDAVDRVDIGRPPPRGRRRRRRPRLAIAAVIVVVLALLGAGGGIIYVNKQIAPGGEAGPMARVTIRKGAGRSSVASALTDAKIVSNATVFEYYLRFNGEGAFQAGEYEMNTHLSYADAVGILRRGPPPQVQSIDKLVIPEGFTLFQIAQRVGKLPGKNADFFRQLVDTGLKRSKFLPDGQGSLEGLLFPATYEIGAGDDEENILARLVNTFDTTADSIGLTAGAAALGITPYEAIIVASLIEREAKFDEDRPKIACVIYNRLKKKIPLGIDATSIYGPPAFGDAGKIVEALATDTPFNTRLHTGLPPTPIASPGKPSLLAAIAPTPGCTFIYYVLADAEGHHAFANTDAEFQRLKAEAKRKGLL